ncbi:MAG: entericidin [Phycisphaeraceae bacterium]
MSRKIFTLAALALFVMTTAVSITGCETTQGAGEDIKGTSERTEEALDL